MNEPVYVISYFWYRIWRGVRLFSLVLLVMFALGLLLTGLGL